MAGNKKETAEQKLLKMIEFSSGETAQAAEVTSKKVSSKKNVLSIIKTSNKVLFGLLAIFIVLLVLEINTGFALVNKNVQFDVNRKLAQRAQGVEVLIPTVQRLSFYLAGVNRRNMFQPFEERVKTLAEGVDRNSKIARATSSLRLVGVSWLDSVDSASVMLEDTAKNTTYFLRKGEKIRDIIVKTIYADSVELGYQNEEIIIRYDKSQK